MQVFTTQSQRHRELFFKVAENPRKNPGQRLPKTGAAKFLAEVFAFHLDDAAHFVQAGAHTLSDTVTQSFRARGGSGGRDRPIGASGGLVLKIRSNDGGAVVVVSRVENEADRVPNPFARFYRAQLVENENVRFEYRTKNVQFGRLNRRVIRILNLLQQFPVVAEQAGNSFVQDEVFDDAYREMSFAGADLADNQQAGSIARVVL